MTQAILLFGTSCVLLASVFRGLRGIWRHARSTVTVRVGDRDYEYTPEMTPDDFAQLLAKDVNEGPKNGRRQEVVHS